MSSHYRSVADDLNTRLGSAQPIPPCNSHSNLDEGHQGEENLAPLVSVDWPEASRSLIEQAQREHGAFSRFDSDQFILIRNAAKLACKFLANYDRNNPGSILVSVRALDVGLTLVLAGSKPELVIAGMLGNSYEGFVGAPTDRIRDTIRRKFGDQVDRLIESIAEPVSELLGVSLASEVKSDSWLQAKLRASTKLASGGLDEIMLSCATKTSMLFKVNGLLECGRSVSEVIDGTPGDNISLFLENLNTYSAQNVPRLLQAQFVKELIRFAKLTGEDLAGIPTLSIHSSLCDCGEEQVSSEALGAVDSIREAIEFSAELFRGVQRRWGPNENMALFSHQYEVGLLLALSGYGRDVIVAGFLHDLFEDYVSHDKQRLRNQALTQFGDRVVQLVDAVTEPPKRGNSNFWERKLAVLNQISVGDSEMAALSCATKISTIAAGNKFLWMGRPISEWSAGSHDENIRYFDLLLAQYEEKGVNSSLLSEFRRELERFKGWAPSTENL